MSNITTKIFEWLNIDRQFAVFDTLFICILLLSCFLMPQNIYLILAYIVTSMCAFTTYFVNNNRKLFNYNWQTYFGLTILLGSVTLAGQIAYALYTISSTITVNFELIDTLAVALVFMFINWVVMGFVLILSRHMLVFVRIDSDA